MDILPSRYAAKAEFGEDGTVTLYTRLFDESRMDESFNEETFEDTYARYAGQPADLAVSATLIRTEYVQVPMESYFDGSTTRPSTAMKPSASPPRWKPTR